MINFKHALFLVLVWSIIPGKGKSQDITGTDKKKKEKGILYFSWGYNRDWYSKSDIHFYDKNTNAYDFTLSDVKAKDRPGFDRIFSSNISIPQYVYRVGYYFSRYQAGIEINFDHTKYIMVQNQAVHLSGKINDSYYNTDTIIAPEFLEFEHTNGGNFLMLNFLKSQKIHTTANKKFKSSAILKIGGGVVIPRTDVTLFGERLDNKFHIAGYVLGMEAGLRLEMFKYFFIEPTVKGSYANFLNVLTIGNGKANHHFWTFQAILSGGIQIRL